MAAIVAGIMFFGAEIIAQMFNNSDLVPLIRIFALYPFVDRLAILIPAFMISLDRAVRAGLYSLATSVGRVGAVITMFALGFGLSAAVSSVVVIGLITALIGCADMVRLSPAGSWRFDRGLLMEQFQYSWPLLATAIVGVTNLQLDKFLISIFFEPTKYAVYSCGAMELPVISLVTVSVSAAMMPALVTMVEKGRTVDALHTWQEAARKCSLIIFPCFVFFFAFGYDFIVLLYKADYSLANWPFRIYLCSLPLKVAVYATLFRATGQTRAIAIGGVLALVLNAVVSTSLVIIGRKSIVSFIGPALGTVIATWGSWWYLLWQLTRITSVSFSRIMRWKELTLMFLVCAICGVLVVAVPLPALPLIYKLAVRAAVYFVILLVVLLTTGMLKEDEKQLLTFPLKFTRKKLSKLFGNVKT